MGKQSKIYMFITFYKFYATDKSKGLVNVEIPKLYDLYNNIGKYNNENIPYLINGVNQITYSYGATESIDISPSSTIKVTISGIKKVGVV